MTQKAFAEKLGVPLRTMEDWLAKRKEPPAYAQKPLIDAFRKMIDEMIDE
jgi:DNA-binding transcriptional regulator YiaG